MVHRPLRRRFRFATPTPSRASPTSADLPFWRAVLTTPVDRLGHDGYYRVAFSHARDHPIPFSLPRFRGVSASTLQLSGPAQALLLLRPARLLAHLSVDFVARFQPVRLPEPAARQLSNLTINYSSGSFPHWYSALLGHTRNYLRAITPNELRAGRSSAEGATKK